MKEAPPTKDEEARLFALYEYDVLDTEAEKVFDDLTLLASTLCDKPITLISLVDPNRQWFKSKVGLDAQETSRDIAFCAHAIHQQAIFEVEDTLKDERFFDNPLVISSPYIRFYAGTPLVTPDGHAIGTLCVIDEKPNKLSALQRQALEVLGRSVISQLELRKKIKQLKLVNEQKTTFLSNMSHELRTPLNAVIGFSQLMQEDPEIQQLPKHFQDYIHRITYSGIRLLSVINTVLDLHKIEAGKLEAVSHASDLRAACNNVVGMLSAVAKQKAIHLVVTIDQSVPPLVNIDEAKFCQILTNLIHNAIKFSASKQGIDIALTYHQSILNLCIEDHGVGMSVEDQGKLFMPFQQVGNRKHAEGSGLGLAITKALVALLGGSIKVKSEVAKGSTFWVNLPVNVSAQHNDVAASFSPHNLHFDVTRRILLVEDNEINQAVMQAIFSSLGLHITIASSGEEAVDTTQQQKFDLVFMDIQLPGIDGRRATQLIKANNPALPIVALSADVFSGGDTELATHLWSDYLLKPVDKNHLVSVLNRFIPRANND
jgi:signal transduction histidine kinase/ActR/RegA family two-component response regulator